MNEALTEFLQLDYFWYWWFAACILMMLEMLLPDMFFMALASAATATGLLGIFLSDLSFSIQFSIFAACAIISLFISRFFLAKQILVSDEPSLNKRSDDLIGRIFTLREPIIHGEGKLKAMASEWNITGENCDSGCQVKVIAIQGLTLQVIKVDES